MHTPGPWYYEQAEGASREYNLGFVKTKKKRGYPNGEYIFTIEKPDRSDKNDTVAKREANARLIAAAPEAASELLRVTDLLDTWAKDHPQDRTAEVDAAIHCARAVLSKAIQR